MSSLEEWLADLPRCASGSRASAGGGEKIVSGRKPFFGE